MPAAKGSCRKPLPEPLGFRPFFVCPTELGRMDVSFFERALEVAARTCHLERQLADPGRGFHSHPAGINSPGAARAYETLVLGHGQLQQFQRQLARRATAKGEPRDP